MSKAGAVPLQVTHSLPERVNEYIRQAGGERLPPPAIFDLLENYEQALQPWVNDQPPHLPTGGLLYLIDRTKQRNFRIDGHNYEKRKDGRNLSESNEKLKVKGVECIRASYSFVLEPSLQQDGAQLRLARRCYWLLQEGRNHLVLIHYLREAKKADVAEKRKVKQQGDGAKEQAKSRGSSSSSEVSPTSSFLPVLPEPRPAELGELGPGSSSHSELTPGELVWPEWEGDGSSSLPTLEMLLAEETGQDMHVDANPAKKARTSQPSAGQPGPGLTTCWLSSKGSHNQLTIHPLLWQEQEQQQHGQEQEQQPQHQPPVVLLEQQQPPQEGKQLLPSLDSLSGDAVLDALADAACPWEDLLPPGNPLSLSEQATTPTALQGQEPYAALSTLGSWTTPASADADGDQNLVFYIDDYEPRRASTAGGERVLMTGELLLGAALLHGQPLFANFGGRQAPAVLRCRGACASLSCFVPPAQLPHSHTVKLCLTLGDGSTVSQLLDFEYVARLVPEPEAGVVPSGAQGGWHAAPGGSAAPAGAQQAGQAGQQGPTLQRGSGSWQAPAAAAALTAAGVGGALTEAEEGREDGVGDSNPHANEEQGGRQGSPPAAAAASALPQPLRPAGSTCSASSTASLPLEAAAAAEWCADEAYVGDVAEPAVVISRAAIPPAPAPAAAGAAASGSRRPARPGGGRPSRQGAYGCDSAKELEAALGALSLGGKEEQQQQGVSLQQRGTPAATMACSIPEAEFQQPEGAAAAAAEGEQVGATTAEQAARRLTRGSSGSGLDSARHQGLAIARGEGETVWKRLARWSSGNSLGGGSRGATSQAHTDGSGGHAHNAFSPAKPVASGAAALRRMWRKLLGAPDSQEQPDSCGGELSQGNRRTAGLAGESVVPDTPHAAPCAH